MTFASPIFRKLFWSAFLVIATSLVVLDFYLTRLTAHRETESAKQRLTVAARVLAGELGGIPSGELERWSLDAGSRAQARVTLINPKGVVLADSQQDPETTENPAHRPEIRQAYAGEVGSSVQHSATLNRDVCYLALPTF